jgi:hypothetical protein
LASLTRQPYHFARYIPLVTRAERDELHAKYTEMLRLRLAHQEDDEPDPRRDMAKLASRFPGALREIDELPLDVIEARIEALSAGRVEPWMEPVAMFHRLTRGALCAKRWLRGRKELDDEERLAFDRESTTLCYPEEARAWRADLERLASPPRGRVTDLVFEKIAAALGTSVERARELVWAESSGRRGRRLGLGLLGLRLRGGGAGALALRLRRRVEVGVPAPALEDEVAAADQALGGLLLAARTHLEGRIRDLLKLFPLMGALGARVLVGRHRDEFFVAASTLSRRVLTADRALNIALAIHMFSRYCSGLGRDRM